MATGIARSPCASYRSGLPGLVELLDRITDEVGEGENHPPLASLIDVLEVLIQKYEDEHLPELTE